jgi:hypothetical protein
MAAPHALKVPDRSFELYAYYVLSTLSPEQKQTLTETEKILVANHDELHHFCNKASHVKIEMLLAKAGIESVRIFYAKDSPEAVESTIFNTEIQYQYPQKKSDLIEAMAQKKIYATSNAEFIAGVMMMAQNAHTKLYQTTMLTKGIVATTKWFKNRNRRKPVPPQADTLDEAKEAYQQFNKAILQTLSSFDYVLKTFQLNQREIWILSTLYANPYTAIEIHTLADQMRLNGKDVYLKKEVDALVEQGMVLNDKSNQNKKRGAKVSYLLTAKGMKTAIEYIQYVYNKSLNE